jgi:hypothetical protein
MMMRTDDIRATAHSDVEVLDPIGERVSCQVALTVRADGSACIELTSTRLGRYEFEDTNWWICFTRLRLGFERNGWWVLCNAARRDVCEPSGFGSGLRVDPFAFRVLVPPSGERQTFCWLDAFAPADPASVGTLEQIEADRVEAEAAWAKLQEYMRNVKAARGEHPTELLERMPSMISREVNA